MPAPYTIDPDVWPLMWEAMMLKLAELGKPGDMEEFLIQLQEYYHITNDVPALKAYIAGQKLQAALAKKAADEAGLTDLDAEIAALQAELNL